MALLLKALKGKAGLTAKKVSARGKTGTYQTTVYVRSGEKPKEERQKKGEEPTKGKEKKGDAAAATKKELDAGLQKWVKDYYASKEAGNAELTGSLKTSIEKKINQKGLNSRTVWASAGSDGGKKERELGGDEPYDKQTDAGEGAERDYKKDLDDLKDLIETDFAGEADDDTIGEVVEDYFADDDVDEEYKEQTMDDLIEWNDKQKVRGEGKYAETVGGKESDADLLKEYLKDTGQKESDLSDEEKKELTEVFNAALKEGIPSTNPTAIAWLKKEGKLVLDYLKDAGEPAEDYTPEQLANLENRFRKQLTNNKATVQPYKEKKGKEGGEAKKSVGTSPEDFSKCEEAVSKAMDDGRVRVDDSLLQKARNIAGTDDEDAINAALVGLVIAQHPELIEEEKA